MSTRFRFGPRPRRLTVDAPTVLVAVCCTSPVVNCVTAGTNCGSRFRIVSTPTALVCSNSLLVDGLDRAVRREILADDARAGDGDFFERCCSCLSGLLRLHVADRSDLQVPRRLPTTEHQYADERPQSF